MSFLLATQCSNISHLIRTFLYSKCEKSLYSVLATLFLAMRLNACFCVFNADALTSESLGGFCHLGISNQIRVSQFKRAALVDGCQRVDYSASF